MFLKNYINVLIVLRRKLFLQIQVTASFALCLYFCITLFSMQTLSFKRAHEFNLPVVCFTKEFSDFSFEIYKLFLTKGSL